MSFEDTLPLKEKLPRAYRRRVGDDVKARSYCPINGTRPFKLVRSLSQRDRMEDVHPQEGKRTRKARKDVRQENIGHEGEGAGSYGQQAAGRKTRSLWGGTMPTAVYPSAALPPQAQYTYSWSSHDSVATPELAHRHWATSTRVASRELSRSPPALTNIHQQHVALARDPVHFQPSPLRATTVSLKPRPEAASVARNASTTRFATTSRHLETGYGPSVSSSTSPSSVWSDNARASALASSVRGAPYHRPAWRDTQGSIWSEDDFIEAYQAFFFPRPTDERDSQGPVPTPRPTPREPNVRVRQTDGGLELATGYVTTPSVTDSAIAATGSGMEEQRPHDMRVTEVEGSDPMDWSIPHMIVTPIDPQRLKDLELAAAAGYAHTLHLQSVLPSEVPETAYVAMHPSPPAARSSYSELAHA